MIFNEGKSGAFNFRLDDKGRAMMKSCPFCGHHGVRLENTHTPSYWIECNGCGAEMHELGRRRGNGEAAHKASAMTAISAWNARAAAKEEGK